VLVLALASAGCGSAGGASDRARADARAYVVEATRFNRLVPALVAAAERRTAATFHECSLVRNGDPHLPPPSRLAGISFIAYYQALLPAYRRYASRLRSLGARDATLRTLATAAAGLGRRYGRLRAARPDFCHTLRSWQRSGWRADFSLLSAIGVSTSAFREDGSPLDPAVRRAEVAIAATAERLRRLGLADADVKMVLSATDAFAAGRGGYLAIKRLASAEEAG
jgi:hypothetical protein